MQTERKIAFKTLGCRLNQYETDALASEFSGRGYKVVSFHEKADVYVVNTCTVTNQSDHKSRNTISQAARRNKGALVVATGCMVNNTKEELKRQKSIDYIVPNEEKNTIFHLVDAHFKGEIYSSAKKPAGRFDFGLVDQGFHTRSMIKIQDGCDNFCSFCIVPKVRGRAVSRSVKDILKNINEVLELGFKEIVLTGVNIGRYRYENSNFENLIEKILDIPGDFRLRLSSMEPDGFSEHFLELFEHPKLMPHLHLCLQSGSENILLKMRRMYTAASFLKMIQNLKKRDPLFNFTTDIIVGFPGETEDDFIDTVNLCREIGFSHIHTFKYSVRNGTRAARMEDQVPEKVKTERSRLIRELSFKNRLAYFNRMLGKEQRVLLERPKKGLFRGYGENYIPVNITGTYPGNSFQQVKLTGITHKKEPEMIGTVIQQENGTEK